MLDLLADLGNVFLCLNVLLYFIGFSSNGKAYKIFTIYLFVMLLIQVIVSYLQSKALNNLYLSHYYFLLQLILLSLFFRSLDFTKRQKKIMFYGNIFAFVTITVQYLFHPKLYFELNLLEIFISSFLVIIYATFHLYNLLTQKKVFYFCTLGMLLYLFGSTIIFLTGNLSIAYKLRFVFSIWILNAALYLIYQWFILFEWVRNYAKINLLKND